MRSVAERLVIERRTLSSLVKAGQVVVSDDELRELFALAESLTLAQLKRDNAGVPPAQQRRSLVMDLEFRRVVAGWPALAQGQSPARFVIKQMRPLEPSPHVSTELRAAPIPRDVLARARRIEWQLCRGQELELSALNVFTDPDAAPDPGYSQTPLLAAVGVTHKQLARVFTHLEQRAARVSRDGMTVELMPGLGLSRVQVVADVATLGFPSGKQLRVPVKCETRLDYAEPRELLRSFLAASPARAPVR